MQIYFEYTRTNHLHPDRVYQAVVERHGHYLCSAGILGSNRQTAEVLPSSQNYLTDW